MKNKYINLVLLAAIAFSPIAVLKAASLIGINYGSGVDGSAGINANLNNSNSIDTTLDLNQNNQGSVEVGNDANQNANLSADSNTSITGSIMTVTREDLEVVGIPNTGVQTQILKSDGNVTATVNGNIEANAGGVATEGDLRAFALSTLRADENLNAMSFANDNVMVSYKAEGRFLGLVPVTMDIDVIVDQEGNVAFDYPWYGFLVTKNEDELEAKIKAEVDAQLAAEVDGGWTNSDRAEIAFAVATALRANYEASANVDTAEETN